MTNRETDASTTDKSAITRKWDSSPQSYAASFSFNTSKGKNISRIHKAYWLFPDVDKGVVQKLRLDNVSLYSTTDQRSAEDICVRMKECMAAGNDGHRLQQRGRTRVLDATACSGGSTHALLKFFDRVHAIEKDAGRFRDLEHNLNVLASVAPVKQRGTVTIQCTDCVKYLSELGEDSYDMVFIDPPWGGPRIYRTSLHLQLYLSDVSLMAVVRDIAERRVAHYVALKVPCNYGYSGDVAVVFDQIIGGNKMRLIILDCCLASSSSSSSARA